MNSEESTPSLLSNPPGMSTPQPTPSSNDSLQESNSVEFREAPTLQVNEVLTSLKSQNVLKEINPPKQIKLTNTDRLVIVDAEDYNFLNQFNWYINSNYVCRNVEGKHVYIHHDIIGFPPVGFVTDHKDRDCFNNKRENLHHITVGANAQNCKVKKNTSGYHGITFDKSKKGKPWKACIKIALKNYHLGYFDNPVDAALAYDKKVREVYGESGRTNFR